jgi:ubiquinone biosynthesis monooxygenase Coq7
MMVDALIAGIDKALRTLFVPAPTRRPMPGESLPEAVLTDTERRHAAALMRVNHVGEICAQALYQGQAMASGSTDIRRALAQAAAEETEHLNWTERRIAELGGRKSLLNPLWYAGSLAIGVAAAKCGDPFNLGFLAETERQVEAHLDRHLARLPTGDYRSQAVLVQMRIDEVRHADTAEELGASPMPRPLKAAMALVSKVMTTTAYWV